jgi:hypothetical protein
MAASRLFAVSAALVGAIGVTAGAAYAQFPTPDVPPATGLPIRQTFLTSSDGWMAMGDGAKVSPVENPLKVNSAAGALQMDYKIDKTTISAFLLQVAPGALTNAKSFHFMMRSDYAETVLVGMDEVGGGHYLATVSLPKDKWQAVELTPADFVLSDGPNDPKDPDNKLDLDKVEHIGIIDAGTFFSKIGDTNPGLMDLLGVRTGPHTCYLADFQISSLPLNGASGAPVPSTVLDTFAHPQVDWMLVGGVQAKNITGAPFVGRGMTATYSQAPQKLNGLTHRIPTGQLAGATKLGFSVASTHAATLMIQVEEKGGGKYNTKVYVPAGETRLTDISVSFADFKAADDSKDSNGMLDLDQVNNLIIIDLTGALGDLKQATDNTLYIGNLHIYRP